MAAVRDVWPVDEECDCVFGVLGGVEDEGGLGLADGCGSAEAPRGCREGAKGMETMKELNPNHPVTREFHEQWHKVCALVMIKLGVREVHIDEDDIRRLADEPGGCNITMRVRNEVIILKLVDDAEAERLAREDGGLPS